MDSTNALNVLKYRQKDTGIDFDKTGAFPKGTTGKDAILDGTPKPPIHNTLFAGKEPDFPIQPSSTVQVVKEQYKDLLKTAENVAIAKNNKLPWEFDTSGKWYSNDYEILLTKINALRTLLGLNLCQKAFDWVPPDQVATGVQNSMDKNSEVWDNSLFNHYGLLAKGLATTVPGSTPKKKGVLAAPGSTPTVSIFQTSDGRTLGMFPDARAPAFQLLIQLELELKVFEDEKCFRDNLRSWILGRADVSTYQYCFWIEESKKDPKYYDIVRIVLGKTGKFNKVAYESLPDKEKTLFQEWMAETKKMIRNNPDITRGFVNDDEYLTRRMDVFLKKLAKKVPRTEEEAYLWFKYIVLKKPVNIDYLCNQGEI